MLIQRQEWHEHTRYIIANSHGSVQLELFDEQQAFGGTAFIWSLWVVPEYRRQGEAKALLKIAENLAADAGHDVVFLKWELINTPREILLWYCRTGYDEVEFGEDVSLLKKYLNHEKSRDKTTS